MAESITEYSRTRLAQLLESFADIPVTKWGQNPQMWELIELIKNGTVTLDMVYRLYVEFATTEYGDEIIAYLCGHDQTIHYLQSVIALSDEVIPSHHKTMCIRSIESMHEIALGQVLASCARCPMPAGHCGWAMCPKG